MRVFDLEYDSVSLQQLSCLELVEGPSLYDLLTRLGYFELACVIADVLCGLAYLHDRSHVHCDIKPENIVVDAASGVAKIIDLDLVLPLWVTEEYGNGGAGTPGYRGIEMAERQPFGTGCVLRSLARKLTPRAGPTSSRSV